MPRSLGISHRKQRKLIRLTENERSGDTIFYLSSIKSLDKFLFSYSLPSLTAVSLNSIRLRDWSQSIRGWGDGQEHRGGESSDFEPLVRGRSFPFAPGGGSSFIFMGVGTFDTHSHTNPQFGMRTAISPGQLFRPY